MSHRGRVKVRPMGIADRIVGWLLRDVSVPKHVIIEHMEIMDEDQDGCISVGELVAFIKKFWRELEG